MKRLYYLIKKDGEQLLITSEEVNDPYEAILDISERFRLNVEKFSEYYGEWEIYEKTFDAFSDRILRYMGSVNDEIERYKEL